MPTGSGRQAAPRPLRPTALGILTCLLKLCFERFSKISEKHKAALPSAPPENTASGVDRWIAPGVTVLNTGFDVGEAAGLQAFGTLGLTWHARRRDRLRERLQIDGEGIDEGKRGQNNNSQKSSHGCSLLNARLNRSGISLRGKRENGCETDPWRSELFA